MDYKKIAGTHLKSAHMRVNSEWLEGCVDFFCDQPENGTVNGRKLCDFVESQWLLADLRSISPGCLPPRLNDSIKTILNGTHVLQMNYVINIGSPAYQQLQQIEKVDVTNIEATDTNTTEPSPRRMLKLNLTDGVQEISGIEYGPIRIFNSNLVPGIKIQIKGPVDCRRGVLLLEEKHVKLIGGEVDELIEINRQKNLLAKIIKSRPDVNFTREILDTPERITPAPRNDVKIENITQRNNHMNLKNEDFDLDFGMFEDEHFDLEQLDELENKMSQTKQVYPVKVDPKPFVYIKQLLNVSADMKRNRKFVVKGQVLKTVGKLTMKKEWILQCIIMDGSGAMEVNISSDLLTDFIGSGPKDMYRLKKEMDSETFKEMTIRKLSAAMNRINFLDCLFRISYEEDAPYIIETVKLTENHMNELKQRLLKFKQLM